MEVHACVVGLMEVCGIKDSTRGCTCTNWEPWDRIKITEHFPDAAYGYWDGHTRLYNYGY